MRITFGLGLDGLEPAERRNEFDAITCGPLGLLDLLEVRLGLRASRVSPATRLVRFRHLIEQVAAQRATFYQRSLEADPMAVAQTLLAWRDALIEAGWDGRPAPGDAPRLQDMARIEAMVEDALSPGPADRLQSVLRELGSRTVPIQTLTVLEHRAWLPALWATLCDHCHAQYVDPDLALRRDSAPAHTDLGRVQSMLAATPPASSTKVTLSNDHSLLCITAQSEWTLAQGVAQCLRQARTTTPGRVTLIADADAGILDRALAGLDEPVTGIPAYSPARPIPQVLALALRLHWTPLDPRALLEFLTHPVCPVTSLLRSRLAAAVAESPGIGGPRWQAALRAAYESSDRVAPDDPAAARNARKRIDDDLRTWVHVERHDPNLGATGPQLALCCTNTASWAAAQASTASANSTTPDQFAALAALAAELAGLLRPRTRVRRVELDRLVEQVTAQGWPAREIEAELGHVHRVSSPAATISPADTVVWWDFVQPATPAQLPWTRVELEQLAKHGARFPSPDVRSARDAAAWTRPLLAARQQILLAWPRQRAGEPVARHPLHARWLARIAGNPPTLPTRDLDAELAARRTLPPVTLTPLPLRPLPAPRRWWKLADGQRLEQRPVESYSSLEKFVYAPHAWVLKYKARLTAGPLAAHRRVDEARQRGTLLHRLLDLLLEAPPTEIDWRTAGQNQIESWLGQRWPALLAQEGANLLLPGKVADAAALLALGKSALWELVRQLRAAGVVSAESNLAMDEVPFFRGKLGGALDLLVRQPSGRTAVVDLKFAGRDIRTEELEQNRELQLAVYGCLLERRHGSWPDAAFFILSSRCLLAQTNRFFPEAQVVHLESPAADLARCWADFTRVWEWRRAHLDAGWIEVTAAPADPNPPPETPTAPPPLPHWAPDDSRTRLDEFDALTGWGPEA